MSGFFVYHFMKRREKLSTFDRVLPALVIPPSGQEPTAKAEVHVRNISERKRQDRRVRFSSGTSSQNRSS